MKHCKSYLVSVSVLALFIFSFIAPVEAFFSGVDHVRPWSENEHRTERIYPEQLVTSNPNDPNNPVKPPANESKVYIRTVLYDGETQKEWTPILEEKLKTAYAEQLSKTKRQIDDLLKTCYKALTAAAGKSKVADQEKAMTTAIENLNSGYKKVIGLLTSDIQSAADNVIKTVAKTDRIVEKLHFEVSLQVGSVFLPPAPGFFASWSDSGRDSKRLHKAALERIALFKQDVGNPDADLFNTYITLSWDYNTYPFLINNERAAACINLPRDITRENFTEACRRVRNLIFQEIGKFDKAVTSDYNNKIKSVYCDPKQSREQYRKAGLGFEASIQKAHFKAKTDLATAIDKTVRDYLSTLPAYRGSAKLRNCGLDRTGDSLNFNFSQITLNDRVPMHNPVVDIWIEHLEDCKNLAAKVPGMVDTVVNNSNEFVNAFDAYLAEVNQLAIHNTAAVLNEKFRIMQDVAGDACYSLETNIDLLNNVIRKFELFSAAIEKKAGKDKAVMAQLNGMHEVLAFFQTILRNFKKLNLAITEQEYFILVAVSHQGAAMQSYFDKAGNSHLSAVRELIAENRAFDPLVIKNAISALISNASKLKF
ncbi:MAG: hypothetical protein HQM10_06790 [Candidatus Riflebacteria bacterium]|nr:hypothetical protein [Candidatus Riflebacteria bacterium]